jgi:hypothetical protein
VVLAAIELGHQPAVLPVAGYDETLSGGDLAHPARAREFCYEQREVGLSFGFRGAPEKQICRSIARKTMTGASSTTAGGKVGFIDVGPKAHRRGEIDTVYVRRAGVSGGAERKSLVTVAVTGFR